MEPLKNLLPGSQQAIARENFLNLVRSPSLLDKPDLSYQTLYEQYGPNDWAGKQLDRAVAKKALKTGMSPTDVYAMLGQSPRVQYQLNELKTPMAEVSDYAKTVTREAIAQIQKQRQRQAQRSTKVVKFGPRR